VSKILRSLPTKKNKSIALPSKGKLSKALKVIESEDESRDEDSYEDPTEKMAMLSNKLEYMARKNRKFLSKRGGYKNSKKEDHKGCFNCKKPGHFIADCPDLQKEKSKDKSKKPSFNSRKFRKQIKKSLMAIPIALEDFIMSGIDRSEMASMIYSIYRNNGKGIGFSEGKPNEISLKACCECIKGGLKTFFVPEGAKFETVVLSEPEASCSKAKITSKPKTSKSKAMTNSDSKTSKIKILKKSEHVP